ncbi:MAG TPA: hypothetical protein PKY97_00480 [Saprospiraceae bacterium]|jgi:hypothetical protein|nr:hypothetical protein [Saprospiraceae bacterium]
MIFKASIDILDSTLSQHYTVLKNHVGQIVWGVPVCEVFYQCSIL